ncbi:hypothetical protein ACIQHY_31505, partial [Streptomyces sp. NPDC092359]
MGTIVALHHKATRVAKSSCAQGFGAAGNIDYNTTHTEKHGQRPCEQRWVNRLAQIIDNGSAASGKRWTVRYREPGGRTGRQREKSFARKKDAVDFATKMEGDKRENIYVDPDAGKVSLRRYADDWLAKRSFSPVVSFRRAGLIRLCRVAPGDGALAGE